MKRIIKLSKKGFTLVELIVVLVILAILAAVLTPTLTGYIEQAKSKKDLRNAKALMEATQAAFVELYAINPDVQAGEQIVPNDKSFVVENGVKKANGKGDQDLSGTQFAMDILELVDFLIPFCQGKQFAKFLHVVGSDNHFGDAGFRG